MKKKDLIIGTITNYSVMQIAPWLVSLDQSGFKGDKYMVCYNVAFDTVDFLKGHGFTVFTFESDPQRRTYTHKGKSNFHVCVDRFNDMWNCLRQLPEELKATYRYIISTDVGDVVFQSNPSDWLTENLEGTPFKINAATESLKYKDETMWGAQNMINSFGVNCFDHIKDNLIYNAGTISGEFNVVLDMFITIYHLCQGYKTPNPDQAAYNLLLSLEPYKSITKFNMSEDGWACQLGTTYNPGALSHFEKFLVEPKPLLDTANSTLTTSTGKPFVIVHQYNRVHELLHMMYKKYLN